MAKGTVFLPFCGELGSMLAKHVPTVFKYATENKDHEEVIACHEEGLEVVYPVATDSWTFPRMQELGRGATGHKQEESIYQQVRDKYGTDYKYVMPKDAMKTAKRSSLFIPEQRRTYDHEFDVLLFPRAKEYAYGRNWHYWQQFYDALCSEGIRCMTAGQKDSTLDLGCPAVWDFADTKDVLDCTIWAMNTAKIMIGTATGTTFLALLCARPPVVIIGENGMDAIGSKMVFNASAYFRMDHHLIGWQVIAHWTDWRKVLTEFMELYQDHAKFEVLAEERVQRIVYMERERQREKGMLDDSYHKDHTKKG